MIDIVCTKDNETDLSLVDYVSIGDDEYEVTFECRQCGYQFTVNLNEDELNYYK